MFRYLTNRANGTPNISELIEGSKMHATPWFSSAATCRSQRFVTLPKFRSRLIQLSPLGAAVSNWAE